METLKVRLMALKIQCVAHVIYIRNSEIIKVYLKGKKEHNLQSK